MDCWPAVARNMLVRMSEIKRQNRRDDPMEVDALSKSKKKGKKGSSGFGKGKGQTTCGMLCVGTVASLATMRKTVYRSGHRNTEWSGKEGKSKGKSKGKGKLNSIENQQKHANGWTWNDEQAEEWWKAAGDQNG